MHRFQSGRTLALGDHCERQTLSHIPNCAAASAVGFTCSPGDAAWIPQGVEQTSRGPARASDAGARRAARQSMLRVPTYVAPSPIAGVGLFAAGELPAGSVIWEFTEGVDWRITSSELLLFPEPFQERLRHYLYLEDSGLYVLCGDNAKYMNHSDDPNCDDTGSVRTITRRRVFAGEELTCDYRLFDCESRTGLRFASPPESRRVPEGVPR